MTLILLVIPRCPFILPFIDGLTWQSKAPAIPFKLFITGCFHTFGLTQINPFLKGFFV
jgi:hypothetical protein